MTTHGKPEQKLRGRPWIEYDIALINDDATAGELAHIASRFTVNEYKIASYEECRAMLRRIVLQSLAQVAVAAELGLTQDVRDYAAVASVARQQVDIMTTGARVHPAGDGSWYTLDMLIRTSQAPS